MNVEQARFNMVEQQIRPTGVLDERVLHALSVVRREEFVPPAHRDLAFADMELPLRDAEIAVKKGQVMLAPKVEARILQDLDVQKTDKILEVGTGSGYMAALLGHRGNNVITLEIEPELVAMAKGNLQRAGVSNVEVRGVLDVESGYANGQGDRPSYEQVCTGRTGYNEVVKLVYDPAQLSTRDLLEVFFATHDATQLNRQGNDVGTQYRSGIYYTTPEQERVARELLAEINAEGVYGAPTATEVLPLASYWPAEDYHQDFYERNPTQGY